MSKKLIFASILLAVYNFGNVLSTKITYGPAELKLENFLDRKVFERNTSESTNYTIIYKYRRAKLYGMVTLIEFDINCNATGKIDLLSDFGPREETIVQATLNILNGTNVVVTVKIFGAGRSLGANLNNNTFIKNVFRDKIFEPTSFALVYAHNITQTKNRYVSLGERQPGDTLIKYESKHVKRTELNNFPESEFMYGNANSYLTHVAFKFSTSSAILFLNSSFINENSFNAMVYDLNNPEFDATMFVYGYTGSERPIKWKSIMTS